MCSAARGAVRKCEANQKRAAKKAVPAKNAKRFFGGPGSHGPSGQAKERTRILPVRRGSFCPACRAIWQAGRSCAASRCCGGFCARCSGVFLPVLRCFVPGLRAAFLPPLRRHFCACLSGLRCLPAVRFVRAVPSCFGCLFACSVLVARAFFSYLLSFAFSCLAFAAQTSFHLSLRPRRGFPCLSPPVALFPVCRPSAGFVPGLCCCLLLLSFACVAGACLPFARLFSLVFLPFPA